MNSKAIINFYKIISNVCCSLIGTLGGFLWFGPFGAIVGVCLGLVLGKVLEKRLVSDN